MLNCYLLCMIASALFGSMIYLAFNINKNVVYLEYLKVLDSNQRQILEDINNERMTIYLMGLALGLSIGFIYLRNTQKGVGRSCIFVVIVMFINYLFYFVYPKSKYMITYLTTSEQKQAWLKVYKTMQFNHYFGMILGAISYAIVSILPS